MQVVIPIGTGSNWDNNELRYCLRSLQNLKFDVEVIIFGEPGVSIPWLRNALYVDVTRFYPENLEDEYGVKMYENYYSVLGKLKWFCDQDICGDEFLLFSDDYLILKEVSDPNVFLNNALCKDNANKYDKKKRSRHERTILEALDLAHKDKHRNGLANYEIHAPRLYNKELLQKLFNRYPLEQTKIPYSLATLFYNLFFDKPNSLVKDESCRHVAYCHFDIVDWTPHHYTPVTGFEIEQSLKDYTVLSYTDKGLSVFGGLLKNWISAKYPDKSHWEE